MALGLGHLTIRQHRAALLEDRYHSFETIARIIASSLDSNSRGSQAEFRRAVSSAIKDSRSDIAYVIVSDADGATLFAESRDNRGTDAQPALIGRSARRALSYLLYGSSTDYESIYRARVPVSLQDGSAGELTFGFLMTSVNARLDAQQRLVLLWFAVAMIIGVLGSVALARGVTGPIRELSRAAGEVADGNMQVHVEVESTDETGELAAMFNHMVAELHDKQLRLEQRANTDSLTGLYNHRFFQERLNEEVKRADRHCRQISVLMIDLDHFKSFNDTHGHPAGDCAIVEVAGILRHSVRDIDVVGRYGGEEFAVIMPECALSDARKTAERIREQIQRNGFAGKDGQTVPMTCSIGVAHYPTHSLEREGLVFAADIALYQAKSLGRNRVKVYSGTSDGSADDTPYRFYVALHATDISTIESLAEAIDARHGLPASYSRQVAQLAVQIGRRLSLGEADLSSLRMACLLRDIGQIGLSDMIVDRDGELTPDERRLLESHPSLGYSIVEQSPHFKTLLPGILHHHERWDGNGYPFGLAGPDIPLVARIVALADAYVAITTERRHRPAADAATATEEIVQCGGTQFDPDLVEVLMETVGIKNRTQPEGCKAQSGTAATSAP